MAEPIIIAKHTGAEVRICLASFKGAEVVSIQEYVDTRMGLVECRAPVGRAVTLSVRKLPALIEALETARDQAAREGLI